MNHHQRHTPPGANRAWKYLPLFLLVVTTSRASLFTALHFKAKPEVPSVNRRDYLLAVGAPELRFQAAVAVTATSSAPRSPSAEIAAPLPSTENAEATTAPVSPTPVVVVPHDPSASETPAENPNANKTKTSPLILPDDTRTPSRPEDFLPFFQFPGGGNQSSLKVVVPVPREPSSSAPLPASSANYSQTPK